MHFTTWRSKLQKVVSVESWRGYDDLSKVVLTFLSSNKIRANTCYDNAMKLSMSCPSIGYVLGRVTGDGQMIDHAWNIWNGIHFDITRETFAPLTLREFTWQQFVSLNQNELRNLTTHGLAPSIFEVYDRFTIDPQFAANDLLAG